MGKTECAGGKTENKKKKKQCLEMKVRYPVGEMVNKKGT
jgi:hypothetical protein